MKPTTPAQPRNNDFGPPMQAEEQLRLECMRILMTIDALRSLNPEAIDGWFANGDVVIERSGVCPHTGRGATCTVTLSKVQPPAPKKA